MSNRLGSIMINLKNLACAAVLALGTATTVQAATAQNVSFTPNVNDSFTFTFDLGPKQDGETGTFGVAFDFFVTITSVTGDNPLLGYFVDGPAGRLTNETTCSGFGGIGNCDLQFDYDPVGESILGRLSAGLYNFGIFSGTVGSDATITFEVSKVPVPAGGLLLMGALGALGLKRRRKA